MRSHGAAAGAGTSPLASVVVQRAECGRPFRRGEAVQLLAVGRPHVARALVEAGYVSSTQEAFDKYLNDQGPAYVHRLEVKPQEVIDTIHQAGGVIVLSSPEHSRTTPLTPTLAALGLDGIEVYYFDHTDEKKVELLALAQRHNLIVTGGSSLRGATLDSLGDHRLAANDRRIVAREIILVQQFEYRRPAGQHERQYRSVHSRRLCATADHYEPRNRHVRLRRA